MLCCRCRSPKTKYNEEHTTSAKRSETKRIVSAEYVQDINVKYKTEKRNSSSGLVILPDNRLVITDYFTNENVKLVDVNQGQVITCLSLSSNPWDIAMVTNRQVAVTIPRIEKIAMVNVTATAMTVDRTLDVGGACYGVDYRDGKLAVSFTYPHKVQVLTLQGRVLFAITTDRQGQTLFNLPFYVAFGQAKHSLYVSNNYSNKVVKVKFDGTVIGTYTDSELIGPMTLLTDTSDHVYVCGHGSANIHQLTPDCRKVQVLLTEDDGLRMPYSIGYSESECRLYVGMQDNDMVKVYRVIHGST